MELEFGAYTIKGKKDGPNQDHYRLFHDEVPLVQTANRGQVFGIFDGMGSTPRASDAAWLVGKSLINFFKVPLPSSQSQITELLYQANQEISDWDLLILPEVAAKGDVQEPLHGCSMGCIYFMPVIHGRYF